MRMRLNEAKFDVLVISLIDEILYPKELYCLRRGIETFLGELYREGRVCAHRDRLSDPVGGQ